ncbi:hypothetical protein BC834DRAFT_969030 [Gloeopeniophorella convolvens]|nr:hypothetical protein BC834DRAFT_969030 [Gloeopeniophorella convolvens]
MSLRRSTSLSDLPIQGRTPFRRTVDVPKLPHHGPLTNTSLTLSSVTCPKLPALHVKELTTINTPQETTTVWSILCSPSMRIRCGLLGDLFETELADEDDGIVARVRIGSVWRIEAEWIYFSIRLCPGPKKSGLGKIVLAVPIPWTYVPRPSWPVAAIQFWRVLRNRGHSEPIITRSPDYTRYTHVARDHLSGDCIHVNQRPALYTAQWHIWTLAESL